jgi:protein DGCR14
MGFIPSTPSLEPHTDIDPSELMTWGMIQGTPLLVDSGAGSSDHVFRIPETPRRDVIGHKLAESASRKMRGKLEGKVVGASGSGMGRAASPYLRSQMLSPAAQKLLQRSRLGVGAKEQRHTGSGGIGLGGGDAQLRASYASPRSVSGGITPNAGRRGVTGPSPLVGRNGGESIVVTNSSNSSGNTNLEKEKTGSIMDDLLNF